MAVQRICMEGPSVRPDFRQDRGKQRKVLIKGIRNVHYSMQVLFTSAAGVVEVKKARL
jgi:hypothetical protein